jgi:hypothetical protein
MSKKIVTLTGHKNTNKEFIAEKLAMNSDVEFVKPYTARDLPQGIEPSLAGVDFNIVLPTVLEDMMRDEKVLSITEINGHKYVFFEFQFRKPYSVIIADDYAVIHIKENWDGKLFTVRTVSDNEEKSERVDEFLYKHEFDYVFDLDKDDYEELEALVGDDYE